MRARSSCPHRAQRQRSGRGQRTPKPWPSWWRSYPVISTPGGKSTSIVTLATVSILLGPRVDQDAAPEISWGQIGMITPECSLAKCQENPRPRTLERKSRMNRTERFPFREEIEQTLLDAPDQHRFLEQVGGDGRVPRWSGWMTIA